MHSIEMLVRLNSARVSRKLRRAARKLNIPQGHAKSGEKGFIVASKPSDWTTEEEWEAKKRRGGKQLIIGKVILEWVPEIGVRQVAEKQVKA